MSYLYLDPHAQVVSKLHLILRPFLLRRLKKDVEKTLPLKKEIILYTPMTPKQKEFHDHLINKTLNEYFEDRSNYPGLLQIYLQTRPCNFALYLHFPS
jgi:SNF2 family DNA or RNA helicase